MIEVGPSQVDILTWDRQGTVLAHFTGLNSGIAQYGTDGHRDITWTADSTGAITRTARYDPWGGLLASSGSTMVDLRYQGAWYDTDTDLHWVVTRWYAPALGRFVSEDTLLGEPANPMSRHLYAYAEGDPVGGWDPDGRDAVQVLESGSSRCDTHGCYVRWPRLRFIWDVTKLPWRTARMTFAGVLLAGRLWGMDREVRSGITWGTKQLDKGDKFKVILVTYTIYTANGAQKSYSYRGDEDSTMRARGSTSKTLGSTGSGWDVLPGFESQPWPLSRCSPTPTLTVSLARITRSTSRPGRTVHLARNRRCSVLNMHSRYTTEDVSA
ncbi:MAG: RHS repeat-associated core domain-containing protein [Propionibacteriaceae bacterium]|nr:RHS repeat-associated core domain-containing protein [Propionibacteriaceae bacterium]